MRTVRDMATSQLVASIGRMGESHSPMFEAMSGRDNLPVMRAELTRRGVKL